MNIICIPCGPLNANSYIVYNDKNSAILIDAGGHQEVEKILHNENITLKAILLTHGHFDHCNGVKYFQEKGVKVYINQLDNEQIQKALFVSALKIDFKPFEADYYLQEGNNLIEGIEVNVVFTPGHSRGGVTFIIENNMFTGDTLFRGNIGRTDLFGGNAEDMKDSLRKLFAFDGEFNVYPGHNESTNLSIEREFFAKWL